ncbi:MAG: glycerophosphodiester phosphodiesterase family protein [Bryobacteraceae bacterium]
MLRFWLLLCIPVLAAEQPARVAVIAHRGEHIRHPENSLSGIRSAIALGADYVELDVRTTLDGRLVLMHDATIDRTTDGKGAVAELTFDRIRSFKLGSEQVPTFEEALQAAHGRIGVYVDAKSITPAALVHALETHDMRTECVVYGPPAFLKSVLSLRPEIRVMPEATSPEMLKTLVSELHPSVFAFDRRDFMEKTIAAAKGAGAGIYVDRLGDDDNAEAWQDAVARGAAGIQTDKPGELVQFLRGRNLHAVPAATRAPAYKYYVTGNPADVHRPTTGGLVMAGGGKDVDDAFRWLIRKSGGGDVVVLRASGGDGYNEYIRGLGAVDSVESIVTRSRAAASDPFVLGKVRGAEAIFVAGGDQWNYIRYWKGTPLEAAIQEAVKRGIPFGGTSAGLAIQGEYSFSAEMDTITSAQALADPFDPHLTLEPSFLKLPDLAGVITDSHFSKRDRMGRLMTFLARISQSRGTAKGVGIDERTAVLLESDGSATISGEGSAYFLRAGKAPAICAAGRKVTFEDVTVYRVAAGGTFNFRSWSGQGGESYTLSIRAGILFSSKTSGSIY